MLLLLTAARQQRVQSKDLWHAHSLFLADTLSSWLCLQAKRGGLANTPADDLLATVFKATFARTGVDPADVGDVVIGSVLGPSSQRANEARIAMFLAGMPETVPVHTVNRYADSFEPGYLP